MGPVDVGDFPQRRGNLALSLGDSEAFIPECAGHLLERVLERSADAASETVRADDVTSTHFVVSHDSLRASTCRRTATSGSRDSSQRRLPASGPKGMTKRLRIMGRLSVREFGVDSNATPSLGLPTVCALG